MTSLRVRMLLALMAFCPPLLAGAGELYLIDAYSEIRQPETKPAQIVDIMDKAGIDFVLLGPKGGREVRRLVGRFARDYPQHFGALVQLSNESYRTNAPKYYSYLKKFESRMFMRGLGELQLFRAPREDAGVSVLPDDRRVEAVLRTARNRNWPVIVRIEFFEMEPVLRQRFMDKFEIMLRGHRDLTFAMLHMGQLSVEEIERLIGAHPNLIFLTSRSTPIRENSERAWLGMFEDGKLAPWWQQLISRYPQHFVLAFGAAGAIDWNQSFITDAGYWRRALSDLPTAVAHAVAHGNAERYWLLPARQ